MNFLLQTNQGWRKMGLEREPPEGFSDIRSSTYSQYADYKIFQ